MHIKTSSKLSAWRIYEIRVSERTKRPLFCRGRNEPIFQEKFKRRILEMLSKTAIAISSSHLAYIFLNKSKYSWRIFSDFIFGRTLKILWTSSALSSLRGLHKFLHRHIYMNIYFSFKSVHFTKHAAFVTFVFLGKCRTKIEEEKFHEFRFVNEMWNSILKRYLPNAFKDHKKLFLALFLSNVDFSAVQSIQLSSFDG